MAGSNKKIKQNKNPKGNVIGQGGNPDQYYSLHPSWNFSSCDKEKWSIHSDEVKKIFWDKLFPYIQELERRTWADILVANKSNNHSIKVNTLNESAVDRLDELHIEAEALISLRFTGTYRIYGYMNKAVYNILWVDLNHDDNNECVCRSRKKHT